MGMTFEIGDAVPPFTLSDTEGVEHSVPIDDAPDATVVIMMCNHCPFVQAWNPRVAAGAKEYTPRGGGGGERQPPTCRALPGNHPHRREPLPGRLVRADGPVRPRPGLADALP